MYMYVNFVMLYSYKFMNMYIINFIFLCVILLLEMIDFSEFTSYEIADLVKLFFRELPESLIPSKLSEALLVSYECEYTEIY